MSILKFKEKKNRGISTGKQSKMSGHSDLCLLRVVLLEYAF